MAFALFFCCCFTESDSLLSLSFDFVARRYILGYDVGFGHMEALNLISSPTFSEKQV